MNPRVPRSRVSHDRWLVSYADFITLMFAFFVVLYAFARSDEKKQMQVSAAINSAFRSMGGRSKSTPLTPESGNPQSVKTAAPPVPSAEEQVSEPAEVRDNLDKLRRDLAEELSSQIASHAISLEMGRDGLVISL